MPRVPLITQRSWVLLGLAALLGLGVAIPQGETAGEDLPQLAEIERETITRVEISRGLTEKMVIEGSMDEGWDIVHPFKAKADDLLVRSLLKVFQDPIRMDVKVDEGEEALEKYLVDDQVGVVVELFGASERPVISVVLGGDMPGGSSFVRLADSQVVYRARVGTRQRVDRDFTEWRDKMVVQDEPDTIRAIVLERPRADGSTETLHFERPDLGGGTLGPWVNVVQPDFPVNQDRLKELVSSMVVLRAGRILSADFEGGFSTPAAVVRVEAIDGHQHVLTFGSRSGGDGAFVKVDGTPEAFYVGRVRLDRALIPLEALRELRILSFQREQVASIRLEDSSIPTVIAQLEDGMWEVAEPANVDADVQQIFFAVNTLGSLMGDAQVTLSAEQTGLVEPLQRYTVRLKDGSAQVLEVGRSQVDDDGRMGWFVKSAADERIYVVSDETLKRVRLAFGRGE